MDDDVYINDRFGRQSFHRRATWEGGEGGGRVGGGFTFVLGDVFILTGVISSSVPASQYTNSSTAQHSTAQHSTAQHSTTQHSTAQHSTTHYTALHHTTPQHNTAQHVPTCSTMLVTSCRDDDGPRSAFRMRLKRSAHAC